MRLNRSTVVLVLIFIVAAYFRFDFLISTNHHNSHDTVHYDKMVRQLLEDGVYAYKSEQPNAKVPPGYPVFMAIVYSVVDYKTNDPFPIIRYLQACMSLITLALIYLISMRISRQVVALCAMSIAAVYPPFIWINGAVLTETLATLLLMTSIYFLLLCFEKRYRRYSVLAGLAIGLLVLTRSEFLVIVPAAYTLHLLWHRNMKSTLKLLLIASAGIAVMLSPWFIRNLVTLHEPIISATQVNPFAAGTYPNKNYDDGLVDRKGKSQMEVAMERLRVGFSEHTMEFVRWYTIGKLQYIYGKMFFGSGHRPLYPVIPFRYLLHQSIIVLSLLSSIFVLRRWREPAALLVFIVVILSLMRLAFVPEYRYNVTAMPILIIVACLLVPNLRRKSNV
ncbi:MAG: glycosyltransferase family 39 protein [Candidatus Cohnella colombiensis]|uniref:Glycosyltransferase family 39 protein n=1 Tax=Candidatus Cohnella colombiensis TaxID=3121368 RepID=A0AA95ETE8_9BACL|nr:MAG: glycosyltransferase family 39 protein [Cohnella sp.]